MNNNKETTEKHSQIASALTSKGSQNFMSAVIILAVLCFFVLFAIKPTISTIFKLQKEAEEKQDVLGQLDTKIENLKKLKIEYAKIQDELPVIMDAIPAQPDTELLFGQIQTVAQDSGVSIGLLENIEEVEILKGNNNVENENRSSLLFTIKGSGSPENIANFLKRLTNIKRIINIDVIFINKSGGLTEDLREFNIQGSAFFKDDL